MSTSLKFGLFNLVAELLVGLLWYSGGNIGYALMSSILAGLCGFVFWKLLANNPVSRIRVVGIGLLTGMVSFSLLDLSWGMSGEGLIAAWAFSIYYALLGDGKAWLRLITMFGLHYMTIGFLVRYQSLKK